METTALIHEEPSGSRHNHLETIKQCRSHDEETHQFDDNLIATLSHENAHTGQKFTIPIYAKGHFYVGRDPKCDFSIDSIIVSKQQFRIYAIIYDAGKLDEYPPSIYCEDLESRNGTYVNDVLIGILGNERIGRLLVDGDLIEIRPDWQFRFHQPRPRLISHIPLPKNEIQYFQDRFTISEHVLGSGIAGEVFLANNVETSKQVACKVVKLNFSKTPLPGSQNGPVPERTESQKQDADWESKSYLREINILSKLNHPNIISIQAAFLSNNRLYMFTELATAGDLYTYFDSCNNRLGDTHARLITRQIALALEYLHSKGIAHRDIKMENILITNTDIGSRIILTDFGLANNTDKTTGRLFSAVGTEGYVAPEVVSFGSTLNRGYTTAADMWSFGILAWNLLTGEPSIPRGRLTQLEEMQITRNFISADEKDAAQKWSYLNPRARSFLRGLLVSDAEKRMTAMQAVNHPWYKKPPISTLMEQAYDRVIKFWKPRDHNADILEYLPGYIAPVAEGAGSVRRKRLPDVSLSPYFNLDRHLQPRSPQMEKRRRIIDDLRVSGECFLTSESQQHLPRHSQRRKSRLLVKSVCGIDLFGSYRTLLGRPAKSSTELSDKASYTGDDISEIEVNEEATQHSQDPLAPFNDIDDIHARLSNNTRARKETDPANQGIHDAASLRVAKFCSAKAFNDEVKRVREEKIVQGR